MSYCRLTDKIFLLLLSCLFISKGTSTQEGSSYFFYQQSEYPKDCKEASDQCSSGNLSGVYTIKPNGYPEPFEVYCNNDIASGGWTIILRRSDGSIKFDRSWEDYKNGFGFLSAEFWIGTDKLSYLTNQAVYELRIDMILSNESSFYVKYSSFRISDEFSHYALVLAEEYSANVSCVVSTCLPGMTHKGCSCQQLCADPVGMKGCSTDCVEICEPDGWFVSEKGAFVLNGESYINISCTENCTCIDKQLSCKRNNECSADATCKEKNGERKCYCNEGYEGDGETCNALYTDCYDAYQAGERQDGVYTILPTGWSGSPFNVSCDMTTAGGGWTILQRRTDGLTDFYRDWVDFKHGFGSVEQGHDLWLGNEKIYSLTNQEAYKLRIDIRTSSNVPFYAEYTSFRIGDESSKYQLSVTGYSGDAAFCTCSGVLTFCINGFCTYITGNNLNACNNGGQFSTRDQDNDGCSVQHYAEGRRGAWWYNTVACPHHVCTECRYSDRTCSFFETRSSCNDAGTGSNLNGDYNGGNGENIFWRGSNYCNLNFAEMKISPSSV